ncbi:hypothetical protein LIU39_34690, partial [Streptomyces sp. SF28]|nr:hypothetical protein [Streptomyces pinistramenti]
MTTEGHDPGAERPVETRLRHALAARADTIGPRDLRPARPPMPQPRRGLRSGAGFWTRRFALPLAAAAAAAAIAWGYAALTPEGPPARPSPASSPT